jgi:coronin-1B/1C/6
LENDKFEFLAEYKSGDPQRGIAFMPKRGVNAHENEVTRAFKTVNDSYIEPVSFIVPRRSENFQDDIYPPTFGLKPAMGPSEWFAGKEAIPPKISMASLYEGEGLKEVTGVQEKPTATTSAPEPKAEPEPKPAEPVAAKKAAEPVSTPTPVIKPEVSMKEQGASMAAMVNKFADKEDDAEPVDDDSSFEEISKPTERSARSADNASPSIKTSPWQPKEEAKSQASPAPVSFFPPNPPRRRTNQKTGLSRRRRTKHPYRVHSYHHNAPCICRLDSSVRHRCCRRRRPPRGLSHQGPARGANQDHCSAGGADAEPDCGDRISQGQAGLADFFSVIASAM